MTPWLHVQRGGTEAVVSVSGEIVPWFAPFDELVKQLDGVERVEVIVDSCGGCSITGLKIAKAIASVPHSESFVYKACSAAVPIVLACQKVRIVADGQMMIHTPCAAVLGNVAEIRREADGLQGVVEELAGFLVNHTGLPRAIVDGWMNGRDYWFDAEGALNAGLVDEVVPRPQTTREVVQPSVASPAPKQERTEDEIAFATLLKGFGPMTVRDMERFNRNLAVWLHQNVREATNEQSATSKESL